jgi:hypothetical protein
MLCDLGTELGLAHMQSHAALGVALALHVQAAREGPATGST